jgi:hypothetical protein
MLLLACTSEKIAPHASLVAQIYRYNYMFLHLSIAFFEIYK